MKKIFLAIVCNVSLLQLFAQNCPTVTVTAPSAIQVTGKIFQISASVKTLPANSSLTYNWAISSGTIVSGQGTAVITVDPGTEAGSCTATVEVGGLPAKCSNTASASVDIKAAPKKIIEIKTVTAAAINDAVKSFISKTDFKNSKLSQTAIVNIYATSATQFTKIKAMVEKAFDANEVLSYQYQVTDKGIARAALLELLLVVQE